MSILQEIDGDLQRSPRNRVVYLEGKDDLLVLPALLGVGGSPPLDQVDGVQLIRLGGRGNVEARLQAATAGKRHGVFGFVDGDGRDLADVEREFAGPGPLFSWPAYAIENLLVEAGWPTAWGPPPMWPEVLRGYAPYVALNRLRNSVADALRAMHLDRFSNPSAGEPLRDRADTRAFIERTQHRLDGRRLDEEFALIVGDFDRLVDLGDAHAWLNGKWLVSDLAVRRTGASADRCRAEWCAHVASTGGVPRVRRRWATILA